MQNLKANDPKPVSNRFETPIAIFVFNRPTEAGRVFERVRDVRPKTLRIICDAARPGKYGEQEVVEEVLRVFENIDWDCDIKFNLADQNLGCRRRLQSGLDWVFNEFPEAIILEDDCLPEPSFFEFMQEKLQEFRFEKSVGLISGTNFQPFTASQARGHYFSALPHIWGWASWSRVWQSYESGAESWPHVNQHLMLKKVFPYRIYRQAWQEILDNIHLVNTWDYQLCFTLWRQEMLCVVPKVNLVTNIGLNSGGTHTKSEGAHFQNKVGRYLGSETNGRLQAPRRSVIRDFLELTVFRFHAARQMSVSAIMAKVLRRGR